MRSRGQGRPRVRRGRPPTAMATGRSCPQWRSCAARAASPGSVRPAPGCQMTRRAAFTGLADSGMVGRMNSRWDDATAATLQGIDLLVYASRLIGAETSLVVWGGGNTSIKQTERDHRGREVRVLRVKGSGSDLKSIQRKDFPGVRMDDVLALLERAGHGRQRDGGLSPLRAAGSGRIAAVHRDPAPRLPARGGGLPHACRRGGVAHQQRECGRRATRQSMATRWWHCPIAAPAFASRARSPTRSAARPRLRAMLLEKHGTICWGPTVKDAYLATIELISRAEEAIAHRAKGRARFGAWR